MPRHTPVQIYRVVKSADNAFDKKDYKKALDKYKRSLSMGPTDEITGFVLFKMGVCYQRLQRYPEAVDAYNQALHYQVTFELLYNKGLVLLQQRHVEEAEQAFKRATKLSDLDSRQTYLGFLSLGRVKIVREDGKGALKALQKAQKVDVEDPFLFYLMGEACKLEGKTSEAVSYFEEASRLDPTSRDVVISLASLYLEEKEHNKALSILSSFLKQNPSDAYMRQVKAEVHYSLNDFENSRVEFSKARELEDDPTLVVKEARCLTALERPQEALQLAEEYLKTNKALSVLFFKAELLTMMGQHEATNDLLEEILNHHTDVIQSPQLSLQAGNIFLMNKNLSRADDLLQNARKLGVDSWSLLKQLAILSLEQGQLEEAKNRINHCAERAQNKSQTAQSLHLATLVALEENRLDDAVQLSEQGVKEAKNEDPQVWLLLVLVNAKALVKVGKEKDAKKRVEKLLKKHPTAQRLVAADHVLAKLL